MGTGVGIRIDGLRETQRALTRLGVSAEDLKALNSRVAGPVVREAQALTPVRSGRLRASIRASKAKNKITIRGGSAKAYYASFVEYGAEHNTPRQMITRAVEENAEAALRALEDEINELIKRYDLN